MFNSIHIQAPMASNKEKLEHSGRISLYTRKETIAIFIRNNNDKGRVTTKDSFDLLVSFAWSEVRGFEESEEQVA